VHISVSIDGHQLPSYQQKIGAFFSFCSRCKYFFSLFFWAKNNSLKSGDRIVENPAIDRPEKTIFAALIT
jgi:hypothetical protein